MAGISIGVLKKSEVEEAEGIFRVAFAKFLGIPDPMMFVGDRRFIVPRFHATNVKVIAAREGGRLIGVNAVTRWGSFGFFGPLAVLPEYWNKGVAQRLLAATMKVFEGWGVRHTGLFTFSSSAKHVGLYQKFGYWPGYLTAIMTFAPVGVEGKDGEGFGVLSGLRKKEREKAIEDCAKLTGGIEKGLDLTGEMRSVLAQGVGDVVLTYRRRGLDGFAVCMNGVGSEGGEKVCYVKFGAARSGEGFDRLLEGCEGFAASRGTSLEVGVNLAREDAARRMRARGYKVSTLGVAMQRPHAEGFNRGDVYVVDDWR